MNKRIEFPAEGERNLRLGEKAMAEKNYFTASGFYRKAYELREDFPTNLLLVKSLAKAGLFDDALLLAQEWYPDYLADPSGSEEYFHLLLLSRHFLKARLLLANDKLALEEGKLQELTEELVKLEAVQTIIEPDSFLQRQELLARLDHQSRPVTLQDWSYLTKEISYDNFVALAQKQLLDLHNPFLRPRLMEELIKLGCQTSITLMTFGGEQKTVVPAKLVLPEKSSILKEMEKIIEEEVGQDDPLLSEGVISEMRGHYAFCFPFPPQDQAPASWARSYLLEYQVMFGNVTARVELLTFADIQQTKEKIRLIFQNIRE